MRPHLPGLLLWTGLVAGTLIASCGAGAPAVPPPEDVAFAAVAQIIPLQPFPGRSVSLSIDATNQSTTAVSAHLTLKVVGRSGQVFHERTWLDLPFDGKQTLRLEDGFITDISPTQSPYAMSVRIVDGLDGGLYLFEMVGLIGAGNPAGDAGRPDAGRPDAGRPDAGRRDAGH